MQLKRTMFREYDIRGREGEGELSADAMYHIARGFAVMLIEKGVSDCIVGHDARGTSEEYYTAAMRGLMESGLNVVDIGTCTTPMGYWAQYYCDALGLFMVTASHNPAGWNGAKLGTAFSTTIMTEEVKHLYSIIEKEAYIDGKGTKTFREDIKDAYIDDLVARAGQLKPRKILVNTGNGTAGLFAPELLRKAGFEVVEHLTNVDTTYPHYTANPDGMAMMEDTGKMTVKHGCDVGLAFDGDGDRLGVTDEKGNTIWPDRYIMLLARQALQKEPGAKIVFDVKVSEALPEDIASHGGVPIMARTGHSYIRSKLIESHAALAGEMSGHIFYRQDFYSFDDASFAALKFLEYLSHDERPLSEIVADTPYYISTPTIQLKTTDEAKYAIEQALVHEFKKDGYHVVDISGARVYSGDAWGLIRASSNTPTFVLRFEAKTEEGLKRIQEVFRDKLAAYPQLDLNWNTSGN